jgi:hypothetical protein
MDYFRVVDHKPWTHAAATEARAAGATTLRVYAAWYSVVPEDARRPPVRAELLGEIPL